MQGKSDLHHFHPSHAPPPHSPVQTPPGLPMPAPVKTKAHTISLHFIIFVRSRHSALAVRGPTSGTGLVRLSAWNLPPGTDAQLFLHFLHSPVSAYQCHSLITSIKLQPLLLTSLLHLPHFCFSLFTPSDTPYILLLHFKSGFPTRR